MRTLRRPPGTLPARILSLCLFAVLAFCVGDRPAKADVYHFQLDNSGTLENGLEYYATEQADSNDVSVNGRTATPTGTLPTWSLPAGKVYAGMSLAGGSSGVQLNGLPRWDSNSQWSFGYWYKVSALPPAGEQDYFSIQQTGAGNFGASFRQEANGTLKFFLIERSIATLAECDGVTPLTPGTWHYVVVTYAGAGSELAAYVDNMLQADCSTNESGNAGLSNGNVGVNLEVDNSQLPLTFDIDELGIWSKVLSQQERVDLYNGGSGQTMTNGAPPPPPPQQPIGAFNWRGPWAAGIVYGSGDAVSFGGSSYVSLSSNVGSQPDISPSLWQIVALKGDQGNPGIPGGPGPKGDKGDPGAPGLNGTSGSVIGGNYANAGTGRFLIPWNNATTGTEADGAIPMPSGTASKLVVSLTVAPGIGHSATVTIRKNGVNTALACTVSGTATTCNDTSDAVTFSDGDLLSIQYTEVSAAGSRIRFGLQYNAP